jgi:hypothetical protein
VTTVREQSGREIARGILHTEAGALVEFFGGMRGFQFTSRSNEGSDAVADAAARSWYSLPR